MNNRHYTCESTLIGRDGSQCLISAQHAGWLLPTLCKTVVVLPQPLSSLNTLLPQDESSSLSNRQQRLSWLPLTLLSGREILVKNMKGLSCSQFVTFTAGIISSPRCNARLGWRVTSRTSSVFPYSYAHHSSFLREPSLQLGDLFSL